MEKIDNIFTYLEEKQRFLTPHQFDIVNKIQNYFKSRRNLTVRQIECLEDIRRYMKIPVSTF